MGLLKFIKSFFSKNEKLNSKLSKVDLKIEPTETKLNNTNLTVENNNITGNYLEEERILKLKYLNTKNNIIEDTTQTIDVKKIITNQLHTIWEFLKIKENTQAEHIINSIPSDKWVTMDEIRHNIKLNFNIEYSNEKSLYPYLKTLTDINLIKLNNTGKKRTWKKNIIIIKKE
jgi:hypothetical protein